MDNIYNFKNYLNMIRNNAVSIVKEFINKYQNINNIDDTQDFWNNIDDKLRQKVSKFVLN